MGYSGGRAQLAHARSVVLAVRGLTAPVRGLAAFKDGNPANGERVIPEKQMRPVELATGDPVAADEGNAISHLAVAVWNSDPTRRSSSLLGRINGVARTETSIVSGEFTFSVNVCDVIRHAGPGGVAPRALRRVLGMMTSSVPIS